MQLPWISSPTTPRLVLASVPMPQGNSLQPHDEPLSHQAPTLACVLVVDDDAQVRGYLRTCLRSLTQHILEASDGEEALHLARTTPELALVISDVIMPRMDGLALRSALHDDPALAHVPVLLITGDATISGEILKKPFNARTLRASIQSLLA